MSSRTRKWLVLMCSGGVLLQASCVASLAGPLIQNIGSVVLGNFIADVFDALDGVDDDAADNANDNSAP